ncbi:MAG: rhodanese-like domain-containing protein [Pseudomonadota bacterium]|nr:rhodanese-like domain-containing protein [Pseudomonadota bacterium]
MDHPYAYAVALVAISLAVAALEALFPWRTRQRQLRPGLLGDLAHLVFNGHILGVILFGVATTHILPSLDHVLGRAGLTEMVHRGVAQGWPLSVQILVALVAVDFAQWVVHNLLHRVPWLWHFHKCHHSIVDGEMDWIVSFRFQWTEVVVYRTILYFPLAFFGFDPRAVFVHAVLGTLIGHLNHANLDLDWGPLRYVLNSPRMHIWHHDYEGDGRTTVNFGIIFSAWDWIFGTARMPAHPPARLGFRGVEDFPTDFLGHVAWPLQRLAPRAVVQPVVGLLGAGLLALGWWAHEPRASASPGGDAAGMQLFGETLAASQPAAAAASADSRTPEDADRALARFGAAGRDAGYVHPEAMVDVGELATALGSPRLVVLDVRADDDYAAGHIPTAQLVRRADYASDVDVPGLSRSPHELEAALRRWGVDADDVVVVHGDGSEAYRLWWTLRSVGGLTTRVLDGGLQAWKAAGHAVAEGSGVAVEPGAITLAPPAEPATLRWADVQARLGDAARIVYVDARTPAEFSGAEQHPDAARAGRIPGAVLQPWTSLTMGGAADPRLRPVGALRHDFEALGLADADAVVTYCQSGTRSSATWFALWQAGFAEDRTVLNYQGSWADYSRTALPVQTGTPDGGDEG